MIFDFDFLKWLIQKDKWICSRCNYPLTYKYIKKNKRCPNCGQPLYIK